jgi:hypothetical protein
VLHLWHEQVLAGALFDGEVWAASWERGLRMARDVQAMAGRDDAVESEGMEGGAIAACEEVHRGGEGGAGVAPRSLRVCARAVGGQVTPSRLLDFNIVVLR